MYDNEDSVCGIIYNNRPFYFQKNLQGDIIAIVDDCANFVARYTYDAWGVPTIVQDTTCEIYFNEHEHSFSVAHINPFRYRGYYYDEEIGMYYLQSRYYDPIVGRFVNVDEAVCIDVNCASLGQNLYTYCFNSTIVFYDSTGFAVDIVFDIGSAVWSLIDLIVAPSWLNFGFFLWDLASVIVPFVPGSYVAKGGKIAIKVASKIDDFADGTKLLTGTYKKLKKLFKGINNIEIHHIVEKRFKNLFKKVKNTDDFLSIPLTKDLHKTITKRWRQYFPYGTNYNKITKSQMRKAIKYVYRDMPQLLEKALEWFEKNWKK